ncbi:zinc-binding dehydrogenase [Mycobacterium sp. pUA109]|uniref:alcohol dehydrogenase catalytic domain-containing protein n=1 Tax=Mycobacterium sp. pUA109 TaxID=3238982 RepID=UPI00351B5431
MKAAVLERFGAPLAIRDVAEPTIGTGEVLVEVLAACVLPYAAEVFSGARKYLLEPPVIPGVGAIGRVLAAGPDATRLEPGALVLCDPTVRSRDDARTPDIALQGWSARGDGGLQLSRHFHHGAFAERMVVPTESAVPLGVDDLDVEQAARWSAIVVPLVPYAGLLAADLRAGETLLVSGATGNFGSSGVAVALAMGAARVVAPGRNETVLADLRRRFGARVRTVTLSGDADADRAAMRDAAGPIDVVLDLLPPAADVTAVRTAAMTVREYGRVVLMGGVGMLGGDDLWLPYPWLMRNSVTVRGQFMCPRSATPQLIALVRAGLLDLSQDRVTTFALDDAGAAVQHAADHGGPFERTVITPAGGATPPRG